ncbi:amino acid adenylation domain-containing protein [Chryseolinea serpens]|uniref:Amino acid adenylation domain-containing protein n=1 Tax=Chryseolinea serpens TaxID=947013 RepID=A0A1M5V9L9_9BACT|nr:non-ribosomal peptide synthetase [Chryseolinea serpens]SHH71920.1 amino acid adenylation domain-containing protein [Chryseolinea serpens]
MNAFTPTGAEVTSAHLQKKEREYWNRKFESFTRKAVFPSDGGEIRIASGENSYAIQLPAEVTAKMRLISNQSDLRLFVLLLTGVKVLLGKYANLTDITVGVPILKQADKRNLINHQLFLRTALDPEQSFKAHVVKVLSVYNEALEHQNYSSRVLLKDLSIDESSPLMPLFDTGVMLDAFHEKHYFDPYTPGLVFAFSAAEAALGCTLHYDATRYSANYIKRLGDHLVQLFQQVVANPSVALSALHVITDEEKKTILEQFNNTHRPFPPVTVQELFRRQVEQHPHRIAVADDKRTYTFLALDELATRVTARLQDAGVKAGDVVGVCMNSSADVVVIILGIIRAGAAYLPIDASNPAERIQFFIADSGCRLLITDGIAPDVNVGDLAIVESQELISSLAMPLRYEHCPEATDRIYIIYTSGSTGRPKGVQVIQSGLVNLILGLNDLVYGTYGECLRLAMVSPFAFDASIQQLFGTLLLGHTLYVVDDVTRRDGEKLVEFYHKHQIDISDGTPTHLKLLVDAGIALPTSVKHFMIGGEVLEKALAQRFFEKVATGPVRISNLYGPTEASVESTCYTFMQKDLRDYDMIPIGKPLFNERIYILDADMQLQPIGWEGEICIAGKGIGPGYINPEATRAKFVADPFYPGERMYRTGDMGRWLPDGNIDYKGRTDSQVKIRGYRIELDEIESCLNKHPLAQSAYALLYTDTSSEPAIGAVVKLNAEASPADAALKSIREFCKTLLPFYMMPTRFVETREIPLNGTGKADRRQLAALLIHSRETSPENPTSFTTTEKVVQEVLYELLEVDVIERDTNLHDIGLHSLKMMKLASGIYKKTGVRLSLTELFANNTIAALAALIGRKKEVADGIPKAEAKEFYEMSPMQKRLYFLQQSDPHSVGYNLPDFFYLSGPVSAERLETAFRTLVARHESLRTSFELVQGRPHQRIHPADTLAVSVTQADVTQDRDEASASDAFVKPFDLRQAPLMRVQLMRRSPQDFFLMLDIHHIISDELSNVILFTELIALYKGLSLKPQKFQYTDYSEWAAKRNAEALEAGASFWRKQFAAPVQRLNLPTDFKRPEQPSNAGDVVVFELSPETTQALMAYSKVRQVSNYATVLAVYTAFLSKICGQSDVTLGSVVSGRTHVDLESVVGFFINTLVYRYDVQEDLSFDDFSDGVRRYLASAMKHQDYPFNDLVKMVTYTDAQEPHRNPVFDVAFLWHNRQDSGFVAQVSDQELSVRSYDYAEKNSKFDLSLFCIESSDSLAFNFNYSTRLFTEATIQEFVRLFASLADAIFGQPSQKLSLLLNDPKLAEQETDIHVDLDIF